MNDVRQQLHQRGVATVQQVASGDSYEVKVSSKLDVTLTPQEMDDLIEACSEARGVLLKDKAVLKRTG